MKFNILLAALLLLSTTDLTSGRTIQKRGLYNKDTDLLNSVKKGSYSTVTATDGHLEAIRFLGKRVDIVDTPPEDPAPESPNPQTGESGPSNPEAPGEEVPDTESGGESDEPGDPPTVLGSGTAPVPRTVVAPKPAGLDPADEAYWDALGNIDPAMKLDDRYILWTGLTEDEEEQVYAFKKQLKKLPDTATTELTSSFDTYQWGPALKTYEAIDPPSWKVNSILSIRFGEYIANQDAPVHILYKSSTLENSPQNSFLGLAELPLVTGPGSKVPVIYRWDTETYVGEIGDGSNPKYNIIWKAGDAPLGGQGLTDLTNNPMAVETDIVTDPGAVGPVGGDGSDGSTTEPPAADPPAADPPAADPPVADPPATEPPATGPPASDPPAGNGGTSDSSSDSGCTICGLGCTCS